MGIAEFFVVAGLLLANAFFVAAEFALVKVRSSQIDELVERGNWAAKITGKLLDHLDAYLSASQFGITLASLGLGFVIERSVEPGIEAALHAFGLPETALEVNGRMLPVIPAFAFLLVTFLHISLGELVPKSLAIRAARPVALVTAPPMMAFYYLFFPVIWLLNAFSDLILRLAGIGVLDHAAVAHTEEELRHIVSESVQGGHLSRAERVMIENVLNLEEKTARRVMVPRPDVVYLSLNRPVDENLRIARRAGHTRFPLCEDDLTSVVGMVHVKDLFRSGGSDVGRPDLRKIAREIPFLPESLRLDALLLEFRTNRVHLAMLLDEYGDVAGMVTLENVLEELVGPIQDEFDRETPQVVPLGDGAFDVDASCPVDVLAEMTGVTMPEEVDSDTTGGLVVEQLGRLALPGDEVIVGRHRLLVTQADPNRIRRVRVEPAAGGRLAADGDPPGDRQGDRPEPDRAEGPP
ncbi:hemolysin family protein [Tautonia plasticadhaerens]|uniref:Magnesium and cobalt efflux protein CorC n=1 Tax=Tautonia plasticadhaerens TaxID=2527974 RepID=A0A518H2W2_9BACT|nr:hemolysin family protein [Tautonia plasticadhaerens]QDV35181.1 Magnesium and cobalt efflux protein CorC [Tautonia plasticadhaerens]